jgi:hypothetical protein
MGTGMTTDGHAKATQDGISIARLLYEAEWSVRWPHILIEREPRPEEVTAWHEWGHTFVRFGYGQPLRLISVIPDERSKGRIEPLHEAVNPEAFLAAIVDYPLENRLRAIRREIVMALAGNAAADLVRGRLLFDWHRTSDVRDALALSYEMHGLKDSVLERYYEFARDLLAEPQVWASGVELVDVLLQRGSLTGDAAFTLLGQHVPELAGKLRTPEFGD